MSRPTTKKQALDRFLEIYRKDKDDPTPGFSSFSNYFGSFFLGKSLAVAGAIGGVGFGNTPTIYLITKNDPTDEDSGLNWYVRALEIVIETIDYVLVQPDKEDYYFHWSG